MTGREITPLPQEMSNLLMEMVKDKQKKQAREIIRSKKGPPRMQIIR